MEWALSIAATTPEVETGHRGQVLFCARNWQIHVRLVLSYRLTHYCE